MSITKRVLLALVVGLMAVAPMTYAGSSDDFSKHKLEKYIEARQQVTEISQEYRARLNEPQDREKAMAVRKKAHKEMVEAVTSAGLTVHEYSVIAKAEQHDPKLRERLRKLQ